MARNDVPSAVFVPRLRYVCLPQRRKLVDKLAHYDART